jgi:WD40 repeat protein
VKTINLSELVYGSLKNKDVQDKNSQEENDPQKIIVSLSFSKDNKYLALLLSDATKDTRAMIYDWYSKNKLLYQYEFKDTELVRISFNPKDWTQVCTSGSNHWKIWRLQEATFK